jgi:hypothetical protein
MRSSGALARQRGNPIGKAFTLAHGRQDGAAAAAILVIELQIQSITRQKCLQAEKFRKSADWPPTDSHKADYGVDIEIFIYIQKV